MIRRDHPGLLAIALFGLLIISYFGLKIVSKEMSNANAFKTKKLEVTGLDNLLSKAIKELSPEQNAELEILNHLLVDSKTENSKAEILKKISGFWYKIDKMHLAGAYANQVAEIEKTEEAWSIAGTTFLSGMEANFEEKDRLYCKQQARVAFENAISLAPENPQHRLNLALCAVKMPDENPMQGILALLDLEKTYPDYVPLQLVLSQLAIQTGQWEKAYKRLTGLLAKQKELPEANCLMEQVILQGGIQDDAAKYSTYCKKN